MPSLGMLVFSSWLLDAIKGDHVFEETILRWCGIVWSNGTRLAVMTACAVASLACSAGLRLGLRHWEPVHGLLLPASAMPAHWLLVLLSPCGTMTFQNGAVCTAQGETLLEIGHLPANERVEALEDWDRATQCRWPWVQLARAIRPHAHQLQKVVLLASPGPRGSAAGLNQAVELVSLLAPGAAAVPIVAEVDFEDIPKLYSLIVALTRQAIGDGFAPETLTVDCTGGLKTASIAASLATLDSAIRFQYVETAAPFGVLAYEMRYTDAPR
nr:hypothetical protein [Niveibacterium sp. COAC-50]